MKTKKYSGENTPDYAKIIDFKPYYNRIMKHSLPVRKQPDNFKKKPLLIIILLSLLFTAGILLLSGCEKTNKPKPTTNTRDLVIRKNRIDENLTVFPYSSSSVYMEILAIRASDGTIRTVFNTCEPCSKSGRASFTRIDNYLVCKFCKGDSSASNGMYYVDQLEINNSGCYPVPIDKKNKFEDKSTIIIPEKFLSRHAVLFSYW